jgi:hypothetical protein
MILRLGTSHPTKKLTVIHELYSADLLRYLLQGLRAFRLRVSSDRCRVCGLHLLCRCGPLGIYTSELGRSKHLSGQNERADEL